MSEHTATPWRVLDASDGMYVARDTAEAEPIAMITCNGDCDQEELDAAFIVRAVNAHYALVVALSELRRCTLEHFKDSHEAHGSREIAQALDNTDAALKLAEA